MFTQTLTVDGKGPALYSLVNIASGFDGCTNHRHCPPLHTPLFTSCSDAASHPRSSTHGHALQITAVLGSWAGVVIPWWRCLSTLLPDFLFVTSRIHSWLPCWDSCQLRRTLARRLLRPERQPPVNVITHSYSVRLAVFCGASCSLSQCRSRSCGWQWTVWLPHVGIFSRRLRQTTIYVSNGPLQPLVSPA